MAAAQEILVIIAGDASVVANTIWLRDFRRTGRVVGNVNGGLIGNTPPITWQNIPEYLADGRIIFFDCCKISDFIQCLPGKSPLSTRGCPVVR